MMPRQAIAALLPRRAQLRTGNSLHLLEAGGAFFPAIFDAFAAARHEIRIETYIFGDDDVGHRLIGVLTDAVRRGVQVRLVVDGFGSAPIVPILVDGLRAAGVEVKVFRPEPPRWRRLSLLRLRRLHRKLIVVDRRIAFVGGINLHDDSDIRAAVAHETQHADHTDTTFGPRYDFAVRIDGPLALDVWLATEWLWWEIGPQGDTEETTNRFWWRRHAAQVFQALRQPLRYDALQHPAGVPAALLLRNNFRFRRAIETAYLQAIGRARERIIIANAYFFPGYRLRRALRQAAKRGVRVDLLLQGRVEYFLQHRATQSLYDRLLKAGMNVYEYTDSYLHAKVAVVDAQWATVGSSNIDPFSLLLAREANVVVHDARFAGELQATLDRALATHSVQIHLADCTKLPWWQRAINRCAFTMMRLGVALTGQMGRY
ncbi:MAG: cardiolipin synthase ClsB [Burkholderiaceae bacterium]